MNIIKIINFHKKWMMCAIKQAKKSLINNEIPIGCIITKNNKILSKAYNQTITTNNPLGHAEIIAIQKATIIENNYKLLNCSIYITKEPCLMCLGIILNTKIKNIIFGSYNKLNKINTLHTQISNKKIFYIGGINKKICDTLLRYFIKKNFK